MQKEELILILDFCGQYNQLIARRVRECNVYCEIVRHDISAEEVRSRGAKGVIFTGGPASVYGEDAPKCDPEIFNIGITFNYGSSKFVKSCFISFVTLCSFFKIIFLSLVTILLL